MDNGDNGKNGEHVISHAVVVLLFGGDIVIVRHRDILARIVRELAMKRNRATRILVKVRGEKMKLLVEFQGQVKSILHH